jgi:hypothetical protein
MCTLICNIRHNVQNFLSAPATQDGKVRTASVPIENSLISGVPLLRSSHA